MTDATTIEAAPEQAGAITPMLVTVGPMTTVCLLHNTLFAAARRRGAPTEKSDRTLEVFQVDGQNSLAWAENSSDPERWVGPFNKDC